ncbi:hypothetical protein LX99_01107 [Mucilaginibacter oryzae]|uniref:Uncharacterized protein n=1 Tax=Mucilaginibacter oryzae TaxID=468058 RepID=A0A316HF78_9SPHI|nr:hypothetical protein LX99_01107 [Mucilaginibacter oryzae]
MHFKAFSKFLRRKNEYAYHLMLLSFATFFDELIENVLPLFYLYVMATVKEVILK